MGFKFMSPRTKGAFGIQPKMSEDDAGNFYADDEIIGNRYDHYPQELGKDTRETVDNRSWGEWAKDGAVAAGQGAKNLLTMPYEAGKALHKDRMMGAFEGAPEPDQSSPATWLANTAAMPEALVRGAGSAIAGAASTWNDPKSTDAEKSAATFDTVSLTPIGGMIFGNAERLAKGAFGSASKPSSLFSNPDEAVIPGLLPAANQSVGIPQASPFEPAAQPAAKPAPPPRDLTSGLYSALDEAITKTEMKSGNAQQWKNAAKKAGVPDSERKWRAFDDFLDQQPPNTKISKEDVAKHLERAKIEVYGNTHIGENVDIDDLRSRAYDDTPDDDYYRVELNPTLIRDYERTISPRQSENGTWELIDENDEVVAGGYANEEAANKDRRGIAEEWVKDSEEPWAVVSQDGDVINDGFRNERAADSARWEYISESHSEYIGNMSDDELMEHMGVDKQAERGQQTEGYLRDKPKGGWDYRERVAELDGDGPWIQKRGSSRWDDAGDPHPDVGYDYPLGWTLEETYNDALGRGKGTVLHEVQSTMGQALADQGPAPDATKLEGMRNDLGVLSADINANRHQFVEARGGKIYDLSGITDIDQRRDVNYLVQDYEQKVADLANWKSRLPEVKAELESYTQRLAEQGIDNASTRAQVSRDMARIARYEDDITRTEAKLAAQAPEIQALVEQGVLRKLDTGSEEQMQKHLLWNRQQDAWNLRAAELQSSLDRARNYTPPAPFVEDNSGMPVLLKRALYEAAKADHDWLATSNAARISKRWDEGAGSMYDGKIRDIIKKLAKQHDPDAKIETFYPGKASPSKPTGKFSFDENRRYPSSGHFNRGMDIVEQPDLPFNEEVAFSPSPHRYGGGPAMSFSTDRPIAGVEMRGTDMGNGDVRPLYRMVDEGGNPIGGAVRNRESAETAMQALNEDLARSQNSLPDEQARIVSGWISQWGEPFFGVRLTPKMKASILEKGFSMFVNAPPAAIPGIFMALKEWVQQGGAGSPDEGAFGAPEVQ